MKTSWQIATYLTILLAAFVLEGCCRPTDEALSREKRQVQERQFIGGLSTIGALIQPLLFMIGMANFMGRIPTFFNRMRDRFSSTLSGTGAPAGAGRKKRSLQEGAYVGEDSLDQAIRVLRLLTEADEKYNS